MNFGTSDNFDAVVKHLEKHDFARCEYGDCLGPQYTVPGLIASLLKADNIEYP